MESDNTQTGNGLSYLVAYVSSTLLPSGKVDDRRT